eukprot:3865042-Pyramimonas_sp.AAC.1
MAPGWVVTQYAAGGEVLNRPETLQARKISDHSAVAVTWRARGPPPKGKRPIPEMLFETAEFKRFMRLAVQLVPIDDLEAWQKHIYFKKLMIAGARFARNSIILRRPSSSLAKYMIVRSAARAVFRQDVRLAE